MSAQDSVIASIFGWTGTVVSMFFFISPINIFLEMNKTNNHEKIPALMLVFNTLNCGLWVVYGMSGGGTQPWVCNLIGLSFTLVYVVWYLLYRFEDKSSKISSIVGSLLLVGGILAFSFICLKSDNEDFRKDTKKISGIIALVFNILMYAAPGQNLVREFLIKINKHNL
jgi:solute carrier family 50 protein (sugar transporter)